MSCYDKFVVGEEVYISSEYFDEQLSGSMSGGLAILADDLRSSDDYLFNNCMLHKLDYIDG